MFGEAYIVETLKSKRILGGQDIYMESTSADDSRGDKMYHLWIKTTKTAKTDRRIDRIKGNLRILGIKKH